MTHPLNSRHPITLLVALLIVMSPSPLSPTVNVSGQLVGLVCLAPTSVNQCPAPPVTITALVGSQLRVSVILQGSDSVSGFDITLKANSSVLKPVDTDISASLMSGGSILAKCIGGVLKQGSMCTPTDAADTIHLAMAGPIGFITIAPTTGLLFTAVYNVTSSTSTTIMYPTGCSSSSVAGTTSCVVLSNGTILPVPENIQPATYTQAPTPTFVLTQDSNTVAIRKRSSTTVGISATSVNGFTGPVSLSSAISPSAKHPPNLVLTPSTVTLASGGIATSTLTISTSANTSQGNYLIQVDGQSGTISGSIQILLSVVP